MLNLITTKLMVPRPPPSVVERPHLLQQLQSSLSKKLILVSAPAGSGKSTLLASWLKSSGRPTAWLSLDKADDDLGRFLFYLVSALQRVDPSIGGGLPDLLQTHNSLEMEPLIIRIINDFAGQNHSLTLVLDDYHLIGEQKIHDAVEFLLDHLPAGLCLVLATRTDPPLALSRLRVRNQLSEIRAGDLRFGLEETTAFLNELQGLDLSPAAISSLEERTEGWIAGLQLAALSLGSRKDKEQFVREFAGSHHYLVDYLMDEVMERQPLEVRQFLERTSILERFTAPLCEAVSGQPSSQGLLKQLLGANLFLIPLDDERKWFRYHHLFAGFLQLRLHSEQPQQTSELHRRASVWFEGEGWTDEAIEHALRASDFPRASGLVEGVVGQLFVYAHYTHIQRYLQRLPPALLSDYPLLLIYYGWTLLAAQEHQDVAAIMKLIKKSLEQNPRPDLEATLICLEGAEHLARTDFARAIELFEHARALLGPLVDVKHISDAGRVLSFTCDVLNYTYLQSGDLLKAVEHFPQSQALAQQQGNLSGVANCASGWGRSLHAMGGLRAALKVLQQGLSSMEVWRLSGENLPPVGTVGELLLMVARVLYERNQLSEVQAKVLEARKANELLQFRPALALELELLSCLHLVQGEVEAALLMLHQLEQVQVGVVDTLQKQIVETTAMRMRLRIAAVGESPALLGEVVGWVRLRGLDPADLFGYSSEASYAILAHCLVAQNKAAEALPLLERLIQAAQTGGRRNDLLHYGLLKTLAHNSLGQAPQALEVLREILTLAEPEHYCRSFVDLGLPMQRLLEQLAQHHATPYLLKLLGAFPQSKPTSLAPTAPTPAPLTIKPVSQPDWLLPLNEREQTILRLLVNRNSNKEIAKALDLSPNTVRWYVSSLLSKLGAVSRLEAAHKARELNLL